MIEGVSQIESVLVIDALGREVNASIEGNTLTLDAAEGMYVVIIFDGEKVYSAKVQKLEY